MFHLCNGLFNVALCFWLWKRLVKLDWWTECALCSYTDVEHVLLEPNPGGRGILFSLAITTDVLELVRAVMTVRGAVTKSTLGNATSICTQKPWAGPWNSQNTLILSQLQNCHTQLLPSLNKLYIHVIWIIVHGSKTFWNGKQKIISYLTSSCSLSPFWSVWCLVNPIQIVQWWHRCTALQYAPAEMSQLIWPSTKISKLKPWTLTSPLLDNIKLVQIHAVLGHSVSPMIHWSLTR